MRKKGGKKRPSPRKAYAKKAQVHKQAQVPTTHVSFGDDIQASAYSMNDTARHTEQRRSWVGQTLRHTQICFVSASAEIKTTADHIDEQLSSEMEGQSGLAATANVTGRDYDEQQPSTMLNNNDGNVSSTCSNPDRNAVRGSPLSDHQNSRTRVLAGTHYRESTDNGFSSRDGVSKGLESGSTRATNDKASRSTSAHSDSSEEVIVFTGRRNTAHKEKIAKHDTGKVQHGDESCPSGPAGRTRLRLAMSENNQIVGTPISQSQRKSPPSSMISTDEYASASAEDSAVIDYITNLLEHDSFEHESDLGDHSGQKTGEHTIVARQEVNVEENEASEDSCQSFDGSIGSADYSPDDAKLHEATRNMSDEALARRLAKQEELGMSSGDILLWHEDDMAGFDTDNDQLDIDLLRDTAKKLTAMTSSTTRKARTQNRSFLLHDELFLGNDHTEFDIMDYERPSLRRNRRRADKPAFELSDEEIQMELQFAWEKDRAKKAKRKQSKQQSRLDHSTGKPGSEIVNMSKKYPTGMSMEELKEEIHHFVLSGQSELSLVPMDKQSRRAIHEVAVRLDLRSKSKGSGLHRFPCLYRTSRTKHYISGSVDTVMFKYGFHRPNKFLGMNSSTTNRSWKTNNGRAGGGTSNVSYRDGDKVGAAAPALGAENKGHALLSKMGWKSGTALGAANNKGSLEPVAHIVKVTRAGLG